MVLQLNVFGSAASECPIVPAVELEEQGDGCAAEVSLARHARSEETFRVSPVSGTVRVVFRSDGTTVWNVSADFIRDALSVESCEGSFGPDGIEQTCTCVAADGTRSECTRAAEEPCCNDGRTDIERLAVQLVASRCDAACVCLAGVDCEAACGRIRECQDPD